MQSRVNRWTQSKTRKKSKKKGCKGKKESQKRRIGNQKQKQKQIKMVAKGYKKTVSIYPVLDANPATPKSGPMNMKKDLRKETGGKILMTGSKRGGGISKEEKWTETKPST